MKINIHNTKFLLSAVNKNQFPKDNLPEVVFVGRSNVGKSSILNALLNRKNLAYVGSTPGKTQQINFFNIDDNDSTLFHMVLNTGLIPEEAAAEQIAHFVTKTISAKQEEEGNKMLEELLKAQTIVNKLSFEYHLNIEFVHATIEDKTVILHGVSDSPGIVEQALQIIKREMPGYDAKSAVSIIHDFKGYQ